MNESESYKNWGLEALISYVDSVAEVQSNVDCDNSQHQITPVSKSENHQNWALVELMNYVKSVAEIQSDIRYKGSQNQSITVENKLVEVEIAAIATKTLQQNNGSINFEENEEIALSPSNAANLMTLIQELHLANNDLVKRVNGLSSAIAKFHQDLENSQVQFQVASSKLDEQSQELATNYQTIQGQQSLIEKLTTELAIANQLVVEVQADCNEQLNRLAAEKDSCRDLRTRLNREQQHSLQLKVALEKCLEVPIASHQLTDNAEDSTSFTPKAPPIQPWTTQIRGGGNSIDLAWEQQNYSSQSSTEEVSAQPVSTVEVESLKETAIEDEEVQLASPIATQFNTQVKSPSPLVYPSRPPKGRKSLASIDLPRFVS